MQTVADILIQATDRNPDATAILSGGQGLSYRLLLQRAMSVGTALREHGLRRGDKFVTVLQNHECTAILHWAAQLYGFVICPVNWRSTASELAYFVQNSGARALFFDSSSQGAVSSCDAFPDLLLVDADPASWRIRPFASKADPDPLPELNAGRTSVILYTSGTTGRGKGVPRSHRAERAAALAQVGQNALGVGDVALGVMPLYHTMGVRILLATALLSGTFVCQPRFDVAETLSLIEQHRVSSLYLVPTLYHDMLDAIDCHPRDLGTIRRLGFAGASMSEGLLRRLSDAFPGRRIVNHYGSSEIYTCTINPDAARKPGSAGRAGLNARIALIPLGTEDIAARAIAGEEGQVIASLQSDEAFRGYLNRPEADAKALRDGWYLTGDVGYCDDAGELFLTGRVDDMIITGGENVMPIEIESVLSLHPCVSEAVVVGKPDARLGQKLSAYIVTRSRIDAAALDGHCRSSGLPGYRCPKEYTFVEAIPKSPVGKILRRAL